ncbi:MAG: hypothetical protein HYY15_01405 [Candidatus Omnitrophica bacterium]|nr:hypothetical protein [Candidatus Omnitrophota bacterium]
MLTLVAVWGAAMTVRSHTERQVARRSMGVARSFQAAEAGTDTALVQLAQDPNWLGVGYTSIGASGYEVSVEPISSTLRRVTATGYAPSNDVSAEGYQLRRIESIVLIEPAGPFDYGLFAGDTIHLDSNSLVDSYDSQLGTYGGTNVGTEGDVGSNSTSTGTITLDKNALITGDAVIGPGGDPATAIIAGDSQVLGSEMSLSTAKELPGVIFPSGSATSALVLSSSQIQRLPAGTYWYTSVQVGSNANVLVEGDATFYVEHAFSLDSNAQFVTTCDTCTITIYVRGTGDAEESVVEMDSNSLLSAAADPTQLTLYVTGDGQASAGKIELDSNTQFYGAIYAPLSLLSLDSNSDLYGAAIAQSVEMDSNSAIHYDVALSSSGSGGGARVSITSWREI